MISAETVFLLVDDVDTMRQVNSSQLQRLGARHILLASNGAEALVIARANPVHVILCDWNMPVMDGLALLREVRRDASLAALPFVMITAEASRSQITDAIAAGVSSILIKPYTTSDLAHHITRAMSHRPKVAREPSSAAPVTAPAASPSKRPSLLVVDDIPDNVALIAGLFQDEFQVRAARDGQSALSICTSPSPPDLILLDVMMPNMDGFELAQHLRSHPQASRIPIIFVTALTDPAAQRRGLELGAVDFVSKPIDPSTLHLRVVNLLRLVEQRQLLQHEYDAMVAQERMREEASAVSRHDLKAPLGNILGLTRGLQAASNLLPRQLQMLHTLEADCQRLLAMIDLASDVLEIEAGSFELRPLPVDVHEILQGLCESARLTYRANGLVIELTVDETRNAQPLVASADELLCFSLLSNLLQNACEASPSKGRVRLRLTRTECIELRLENAPAVPAAFRAQFFDKYATYGKARGSGLGTYSARLLAEAQGGQLVLEVDDDADLTCLVLSLPIGAPSTP